MHICIWIDLIINPNALSIRHKMAKIPCQLPFTADRSTSWAIHSYVKEEHEKILPD